MTDAKTSVAFDRAADAYDATRDLPEPLSREGIPVLLGRLQGSRGAEARLLEVGTGTGRIAIPLLERGARLVGCDLSWKMLARQREKSPSARLAQASATALPFGDGRFDGVLTVHVLHLVGDWPTALREIRRVLVPGGVYVNDSSNAREAGVDAEMRAFWRRRVDALGGGWRRPGVQSRGELHAELARMGAQVDEVVAARFEHDVTPQSVIDNLERRAFSDTWNVPDDVMKKSVAELRAWATATYGPLGAVHRLERRFLLDIVRFDPAARAAESREDRRGRPGPT